MSSAGTDASGSVQRPLPPPPPDWQPPRQERRGKGWIKAIALLLVLLILLSVLFLTPIGRMMLSEISGNSYPESATFVVNRVITIDVESGEISYACDIPVPRTIPNPDGETQEILSAEHDFAVPIEKYSVNWIEWTGTTDLRAEMDVSIAARVHTVIWPTGALEEGMASDIPADRISEQCGNEWEITDGNGNPTGEFMIWPDNPTISELSRDLTSENLPVYKNVENVYEYLRDNLEYRTVSGSEPKSCIQTLADGTGDCDDQSMLFISLLRAAGIPAWMAFGVLYDGVRDEWGAHAWAEVCIPIDETGWVSATVDVVNGEFLVRNCNRLEEWKSDGDGEHLADYYHTLTYNYTLQNPHQQVPAVMLTDVYSGEYEASSEKVYAWIDSPDFFSELLSVPRKVF